MKEIAFQAGVSLATVDRYVHDRPGVQAATRLRIQAAVQELSAQYGQSPRAARLAIDVVIDAPGRFTQTCRAAFEAEAPALRPASLRTRFHLGENMDDGDVAAALRSIAKRRSDGVVLKARATPKVHQAVTELIQSGIPVVTFVTDLPITARRAYVGMDNASAGRSVAWLMAQMMGPSSGRILITLSDQDFQGEAARAAGFEQQLHQSAAHLATHVVTQTRGRDSETAAQVSAALHTHPDITAVYSCGGANQAILQAFSDQGHPLPLIAGHDLDQANRRLLAQRQLCFVVHHDVRSDARRACQHILQHHCMLSTDFDVGRTAFSIVTPFSLAHTDVAPMS